MISTIRSPGHVRQPGEWDVHVATWTAWPSHPEFWEGHVEAARKDVAGLVRALCTQGSGGAASERVRLWVDGEAAEASARAALEGLDLDFIREPFGDIWFRDIAPVFVRGDHGIEYRTFRYNGWGGKYFMENDDTVAARIAGSTGLPGCSIDLVFEGGALDVDGTGLGLTTRSCLLNPNRNPHLGQAAIEAILAESLGVDSLIWLGDGLLNDHTDGHVDNIARFVGPGRVVCQHPAGNNDPNRDVLRAIAADLRAYRTPSGRALDVVEIPSPGRFCNPQGDVVPASHMNFYIANHRVVVPVYGTPSEGAAIDALQRLFPDREVVGLPAQGVLMGGGSFHCITQQQPV